MRTCPKCGRTFQDETAFCPRDGTALASPTDATTVEPMPGLARRYRIIRPLGSGGMGTVFLAEQVAVGNRPVALKLLQRNLLDDPEFLTRFHLEASSTGRVRHPNVVTIYESGQDEDGAPYIAMEYLEGETLGQAMQARGALSPAEAAEILEQAGRGLNAAHKLGIIHRDLKPDNIFLAHDDEGKLLVKVVDFGIAKLREVSTHTVTGAFLGTPAYMSFEQAAGMRSNELDARSDVYSLGIVAYEMLTGRVPFDSDTTLGFVRKHLTEPPPRFQTVNPDLAGLPQLENVVMKALEKDRDQRYATVLEFVREFVQAAKPSAVPASSGQAIGPLPEAGASDRAAGVAAEAAGPGVAVQTPLATPTPAKPAMLSPELATEQPSASSAAPSRTHSSRFRAPRGPSVNLEKYDKRFKESDPRGRRYSVQVVFLGVLALLGAVFWTLSYTFRHRQELRMPSSAPAPPMAGVPQEPPPGSPPGPPPGPPPTGTQAPVPPGVASREQWQKFAEEQKEKGLQEAQRILGEVGGLSGEAPKVIFEPSEPKQWEHPLRPRDRVDDEYIDGGLRLEASPLPPALIARAARGSKVKVQLEIEANGTVHKGHRLEGDRGVADGLIQAAKQTWRFSPPVSNGVPVRTSAAVAVQF
jgi:eukaryotic-like serine/threonine-protein kinase